MREDVVRDSLDHILLAIEALESGDLVKAKRLADIGSALISVQVEDKKTDWSDPEWGWHADIDGMKVWSDRSALAEAEYERALREAGQGG